MKRTSAPWAGALILAATFATATHGADLRSPDGLATIGRRRPTGR